ELCRFVSPQVAALISSDDGARLLEGHRREITALYCDLHGFVSFSQSMDPEEVLNVLREYHAAMGELVLRHGGTLDRFDGERILVFFNDPVPTPHHERAAVSLALAMRDRADALATDWKRKGYDLGVAIGINTGYATLG